MDINKVLHMATEAGKIILENGGETYRVEETILRICSAYNIKAAESYVTTTGIMVSVSDVYGNTISLVKRVRKRTVDLEKISKVNDLSRSIKTKGLTTDEVIEELRVISSAERYDIKTTLFFASIVASFFTVLFGGSWSDFISSFFIGGIIKLVTIYASKFDINDFFVNILGGIIAASLAILSVKLGFSNSMDKIIIGSIMLLVPGLAITNAIRDTISGDLVAGLARTLEAFLIASGIAIGTGIILRLWISYSGGM